MLLMFMGEMQKVEERGKRREEEGRGQARVRKVDINV
jgi:hypothetical protein